MGPALRSELEVELASQLQLARIARAGDLARTAGVCAREGSAQCRRRQAVVNVCPLRVVEDVEAFKPQLDARVLGEVKVLVQSHVEIKNPRAINGVAMKVAKASRSRGSKGGRVVPHGILPRRLIMAGADPDWSTYVVRANVAKAAVAQVTVGVKIAAIGSRAGAIEARASTPELRYS